MPKDVAESGAISSDVEPDDNARRGTNVRQNPVRIAKLMQRLLKTDSDRICSVAVKLKHDAILGGIV